MKPRWRPGLPNAPGLWIIHESNGDFDVWEVSWDKDEDAQMKYLRFTTGNHDNSEPVNGYPWPPRRCLGPFQKCREPRFQ
jgi:hypothetical protein